MEPSLDGTWSPSLTSSSLATSVEHSLTFGSPSLKQSETLQLFLLHLLQLHLMLDNLTILLVLPIKQHLWLVHLIVRSIAIQTTILSMEVVFPLSWPLLMEHQEETTYCTPTSWDSCGILQSLPHDTSTLAPFQQALTTSPLLQALKLRLLKTALVSTSQLLPMDLSFTSTTLTVLSFT